jgi:hypothetical protein
LPEFTQDTLHTIRRTPRGLLGVNAEDIQDPNLPTELTVQIAHEWRNIRADLGCFMFAGTESAPQAQGKRRAGRCVPAAFARGAAVTTGVCPPDAVDQLGVAGLLG